MEKHVNTKHTSSRRKREFKCEVCGKIFASKKSVHGHMICHVRGTESQSDAGSRAAEERNKFKCDECGKMFSSKNYLSRHTTSHSRTKVCLHPTRKRKSHFSFYDNQASHSDWKNGKAFSSQGILFEKPENLRQMLFIIFSGI